MMNLWKSGYAYTALILSIVFVISCRAGSQDFEDMQSSEEQFHQRQSNELVTRISLDDMFEDRQVRALAEAAGSGDTEKVESLAANGVEVNSRGKAGATPLFWALRNSNFEGYEKLLELGADPNIIFSGSSVMHWASRHEDIRFLRAALDNGGDPNLVAGNLSETPLFKTIGVRGGENIEGMQLLIDHGANIDAMTEGEAFGMSIGGKTPLLVAADVGRFDLVYELLNLGADYRIEDDSGRDLVDRIVSFHGRYSAGSDSARNLEKVIHWLSEKGIAIPGSP